MALWGLLMIPGTVLLLGLLLGLSDMAEKRIVSPRALILRAVTGRRTTPDVAESLVTAEFERLLRRQRS